MAVRREQVILDLQDNLTPGLARAAVAAGLLDKELKGLGGTSTTTGRDLDKPAAGAAKVGDSSRKAGPEVDRLSGRLRLLTDAAVTLGPALIPIGAGAIPVLTASLVGLTSAAGAVGVTVLAFKGIGDGLKALDTAQLEPTAENLEALRLEMEKLGPAGAEFVRFLDDLEPTLADLQNVARSGLFPGVEDGIDGLLENLPQVRRIVADLAEGMGDLARDAGQALGGDEFSAFFDYMETDARPTLEAFARSAGNVVLGVSNMLVAFAPLNRDFTGGLEDATKAFADWSKGLDDNESFQEFLSYVRESGPQVVEFLGALVGALTGLIQAAAPLGQVVLPALTGVAKVFAAIAKSPIGPGLYAAAAGFIAFNRAASIAGKTSEKFTKTWEGMSRTAKVSAGIGGLGLMAASMTDLDDKAGLANTAMFSMAGLMVGGPWGAAVGAGIGLTADLADANNDLSDAIQAANDAMNTADIDEMKRRYAELGDEIQETAEDSNLAMGGVQDLGFGDVLPKLGSLWSDVSGETDRAKDTFNALGEEIGHTTADVGLFSTGVLDAADSVQMLSGALSNLQGWLDKRAALRDYRDGLRELAKGLKDGFGRADVENIDAVGENLIKVANSITDPALKQDFLTGAINSLNTLAEKSSPKAAAQIQKLIDKMTDLGLAKVTPRVDADTQKAEDAFERTRRSMGTLDRTTADPKVRVDTGDSIPKISTLRELLGGLHDRSITVRVNQIGGVTSSAGGHSVPAPTADGGTVPKSGRAYADRYHYLLADGEEVISNRHGQADRHRSLLKAINAGRMADGGTSGGPSYHSMLGNHGDDASDGIRVFVAGVWSAAKALKALNKELDAQQKAYDKAKSKRDAAVARRDQISGDIQSGLAADPWADIEGTAGSSNVWAAGATPGTQGGPATAATATAALQASTARARRLVAAINTLKQKGITGPVLLEIIGTGDVERAEMMASLDLGTLSSFAGAFNENQQALAAAGLAGGNAIEGDNIRATSKRLDRLHDDLQEIKQAVNQAEKANDKAADRNAEQVASGVNGAASKGHKRGKR